ncbi:hypothetical protein ACH5RR_011711 [Cinchona calisaya]|uniref:Alpha-1,3-glucosyltransferase n=1 Tax=Cinchona calisaya TaxID=153742 RepID=A0ABD3A9A7_9GENT
MSAYFAPAFFSYLLGKCLRRKNPVIEVAKLGFAVLGTFAIVLCPYLYSTEAFFEVLTRLAPFERGIYEDYVANFWCTTSILIKWKRLFTTSLLKLISLAATVSTCLPSTIQLIWIARKSTFLYGPIYEDMERPIVFLWLIQNALLSMFPLLTQDKLVVPYIALYGLFILLYNVPGRRQHQRESHTSFSTLKIFLLLCFLLHVVYLTVTPPRKYPFLFEAVIMLLCFSQFVLIFLYTNSKQWTLLKLSAVSTDVKKHL